MILFFWYFNDLYNIIKINVNNTSFCQLNCNYHLLQSHFPMACCCNPLYCHLIQDFNFNFVVTKIHLKLH